MAVIYGMLMDRDTKGGWHMITDGRKTLGVFMNKADLNFQTIVQHIVQQRAKELGYDVFFFFTVGHRESMNFYDVQEKGMFAFTPMEKLDGALVTPDAYDMAGFRETLFGMLEKRAQCPIVCVRDNRSAYDSLYTDETMAIRPLLAHLLDDHGYRKVCFQAGYPEHADSNLRLQCYLEEMEKRGIPLPKNAVFHGSMWTRGADKAYHYFFDDPDHRPEAIVCANDYMAQALIEQLQDHGYRVPQDVAVTGFDDIDESAHAWPALTTVGQNYVGMVNEAMDLLHQRIQAKERGEAMPQAQRIGMPGSLEVRESCGCMNYASDKRQRDELRRLGKRIRAIHQREVSQTYFSIELNGADDYANIHRTIFRKLDDTPTLRDFYLCLFEDEHGYAEAITPRARLVSAIRDRQDAGMPYISFDRTELLPSMAERADEPQAFYVHLLHQRESTYGYTVMQFQDGETPSMFYLHWNIIISIALRNLADQFKLRRLYEERHRSSITDALTGLYNRRGFEEQLEPQWAALCREQQTVCFATLDLDNLKPINDTYGHQSGDEALCAIAAGIRAAIMPGAIPARTGGDEYLVFLPNCDQAGAAAFKAAFEQYLAQRNREAGVRFSVGASVGARVIRLEAGITVEQCINESDKMMYQEKKRRHAELERHARTLR